MPVDNVLPTDTPNAGRVKWNNSDNDLQSQINTDTAALTTHKSSSDHDGRYYTEAEVDATEAALQADIDAVDAAAVKLTGAQTVAGVKTLTSNPVVKNASPAVEFTDVAGALLGKVSGVLVGGIPFVQFHVYESGAFIPFMTATSGVDTVNFTKYVTVNGIKLASEDYVNQRVRSSISAVTGTTASLGSGIQGYTQENSADQKICTSGMTVVGLRVSKDDGTLPAYLGCSVQSGAVKISVTPGGGSNGTIAVTDAAGNVLASGAGAKGTGVFICTLLIAQ